MEIIVDVGAMLDRTMGREWPPTAEDWDEAEAFCRELSLGPLLDKMSGGMNPLAGATGWQLSHGERRRLFLARALLRGGELTLLDESFAALDPDNLRQALLCAREREVRRPFGREPTRSLCRFWRKTG